MRCLKTKNWMEKYNSRQACKITKTAYFQESHMQRDNSR